MAWRLSTGMATALLGGTPSAGVSLNKTSFTMGNGDGTGGNDTFNDSGASLGSFDVGDWVLFIGGVNDNVLGKVLIASTTILEFTVGTFATQATGTAICAVNFDGGGSVQEILKNGTMDLYSSTRPTNADTIEAGTKLLPVTMNGDAFVAGTSTNGINLGQFSSTTLKRAIDPLTGVTEIWKGAGLSDGTAGWARWYANDKTTGASSLAIRMDGVVATSGGDVNMVNGTTVATGIYSEVSDVSMTMTAV